MRTFYGELEVDQQEGTFLGKLSALIGPPRRLGANRGPGVELRVQRGSARTPARPPRRRRDPHRQADSGALIAVRGGENDHEIHTRKRIEIVREWDPTQTVVRTIWLALHFVYFVAILLAGSREELR